MPISRLAECVTPSQADVVASRLLAPVVGHVGDGNFHLRLLVDMNDADEVKRAEGLCERLVERSLAMDGTCTGEHGVGQGKMKYLMAEHGPAALAVMAAIKRALDPQDILNPGKIVALAMSTEAQGIRARRLHRRPGMTRCPDGIRGNLRQT